MRAAYRYLSVVVMTVVTAIACHATTNDSILTVLDTTIKHSKQLYQDKEQYIGTLRQRLNDATNASTRFELCNELYNEYKYFQYDSAYHYADKMYRIALNTNALSSDKLALARIALMECYNSVGLFKDADDMLRSISVSDIPADRLIDFYRLCATYYRNMSSYVGGSGTQLGARYIDSLTVYNKRILDLAPEAGFDHATARITALELNGASHIELAQLYAALPKLFDVDNHGLAVVHSQAGREYRDAGDNDKATAHLAQSAIYDLLSCTRETTAAKDLAQMMHDSGDLDRANSYIHHALSDAVAFNSRMRQIEINNVLPHIETSLYNRANTRIIVLTIIALVIGGFLVLSISLFVKLRHRNETLSELNTQLKETAEIKDQYIIQSLVGNTDFIDTVEDKVKRTLTKLKSHQTDQAAAMLQSIDTRTERQRMYSSFDTAFLRLFPNFPEAFNALFPPQERMAIDAEHGLPTDVRIYALMRLGIDSTAEVSKYLNLSANTIYVYKTRLKARAIVPKDDFDSTVMAIPKP